MFVPALFMLIVSDTRQQNIGPSRDDVQYWSLPTGSHVAFKCFTAGDSGKRADVVFVHGGPGAYQVSEYTRGEAWYRKLAGLGFSVYLYDQIGSGLSARLSDPAQYTVARHIADLEAIRVTINPERFILVGDSWGATLVANYIASNPNKVARAIFTSPGAIDPSEWTQSHSPTPRVSADFLTFVKDRRGEQTSRRYEDLDALLQSDVQSAYTEYPDSEMDPLMDQFIESILHTTVHEVDLVRGMKFHGMGWWANIMIGWSASNLRTNPRGTLSRDHTPVLILKGDRDFLPEPMALQYQETFPQATLIRIGTAGHFIWLDKPHIYATLIEMFLLEH